jgi:hypothetical protein
LTDDSIFLAVFLAWARVQPEILGPKKCRKRGVGAVLSELRAELPGNGIGPRTEARREAVQILESHCRLCGRCSIMERYRAA